VGFHENFWVICGTAAPVIALAAVVSYGDLRDQETEWSLARDALGDRARRIQEVFQEAAAKGRVGETNIRKYEPAFENLERRLERADRSYRLSNGWAQGVQFVNLILQAVLLCVALVSVANQANLVTPIAAIVAAVGGILCLAAVAYWLTTLKSISREIRELKDGLPEPGTLKIQ
jgi:hypothetical protein